MVYTVALVALSSLRFYDNVAITFSMASTIFFLSLAVNILSSILPTSASPLAASSNNQSSSSPVYVAVSRPPKPPICPKDLGPIPPRTTFFARDCENAVAMIPRDIRPSSPLRNFYLLAEHVDPAMPNVQLPFERESGMWNITFLSCILKKAKNNYTQDETFSKSRHCLLLSRMGKENAYFFGQNPLRQICLSRIIPIHTLGFVSILLTRLPSR